MRPFMCALQQQSSLKATLVVYFLFYSFQSKPCEPSKKQDDPRRCNRFHLQPQHQMLISARITTLIASPPWHTQASTTGQILGVCTSREKRQAAPHERSDSPRNDV